MKQQEKVPFDLHRWTPPTVSMLGYGVSVLRPDGLSGTLSADESE